MSKKDKLPQVYRQVSQLRSDIAEGKSKRAEKQKLLDIADRAQREAAEQSFRLKFIPGVTQEGAEDQSDRDELLFSMGVYLIGSGAEYLEASDKREIAGGLIAFGSALIDRMTKAYLEVDFINIKENLLSEDAIESFSRASEVDNSDLSPDQIKKFLNGFLDLVEFLISSTPFRQVINFMCEHAQNKVLATTLENSRVNTEFDRLLQAIWISDVEPRKGHEAVAQILKVLPEASFLRVNMASHLLIRAYWNHWKSTDRLLILESAAETLKSPSTALTGKGEIKRMIMTSKILDD